MLRWHGDGAGENTGPASAGESDRVQHAQHRNCCGQRARDSRKIPARVGSHRNDEALPDSDAGCRHQQFRRGRGYRYLKDRTRRGRVQWPVHNGGMHCERSSSQVGDRHRSAQAWRVGQEVYGSEYVVMSDEDCGSDDSVVGVEQLRCDTGSESRSRSGDRGGVDGHVDGATRHERGRRVRPGHRKLGHGNRLHGCGGRVRGSSCQLTHPGEGRDGTKIVGACSEQGHPCHPVPRQVEGDGAKVGDCIVCRVSGRQGHPGQQPEGNSAEIDRHRKFTAQRY